MGKLDTKTKVEVRVGIATGLVVAGDLIGEGGNKERAVTGETPNFAARLQGLATPGSAAVSAATRRLLGGHFALRELGPQMVKGLDAPVHIALDRALGCSVEELRRLRGQAAAKTLRRHKICVSVLHYLECARHCSLRPQELEMNRLIGFQVAVILTTFVALSEPALAVDSYMKSPAPVFVEIGPNVTRWELRGGVLGSTWGPETGEPYLNGEIIAPKFVRLNGWYDFLIPRARVGAMGNLAGGTSYVDAGGMWTVHYRQYFVDFFLGGAVHNGQINGHYTDPTRNKLGCRALYHVGWNVGYQLDPHWNVQATFDHVSDGAGTLSDCRENQGVTGVGLRLGYAF